MRLSITFFASEENNITIDKLKIHGVQLKISEEELSNQTNKLNGNIFVVSGAFTKVTRTELKQLIEQNGGKISSSISKKTNYVVAGDKMGPSKKTKAESLEIPIITEEDFLLMIS